MILFKIYKIASNYFDENYSLNATVLLELIKANFLSIEDALHDIPFIHSGYVSIIKANRELQNDN